LKIATKIHRVKNRKLGINNSRSSDFQTNRRDACTTVITERIRRNPCATMCAELITTDYSVLLSLYVINHFLFIYQVATVSVWKEMKHSVGETVLILRISDLAAIFINVAINYEQKISAILKI